MAVPTPDDGIEKGPRPPLSLESAQRIVAAARANTVVLVEGWSDQAAVETLAQRVKLDLAASGIVVLPIGGATNARQFAACFGAPGLGLRLAGLYDWAEEKHFLRAIAAGAAAVIGLVDLDAGRHGFYACSEDLEDELIRALGPQRVEQVIEAEGELGAFRRFQAQPAQRERPVHAQLRRFMGTKARRKIRYGGLLAAAVELHSMPPPLSQLLAYLKAARPRLR